MKLAITNYEKKNYMMKNKKDFVILSKIKEIEKKKLNAKDKEIIKLVRTQLKNDWRTPLIVYLNKLSKNYRK